MLEVIKRDGRRVPFNWQRISRAVERAGFTGDEATTFVMSLSAPTRIMEVWEIQAWVERELIEQGYLDVAKSYVNYRFQKDLERRRLADSIQTLQSGDKSVVNENANKDSNQFHTQRDLTAGAVAKSIGLGMLPPEIAEAHKNGDLWWHDLDYTPYAPLTNCCLINFPDLFANGFTLGNAQIESPKSIQTATAQTSQIIAQVASSQYGGATFNNIDIVLAPFAQMNYEKHLSDANTYLIPDNTTYAHEKTVKDIYDAMQALEYELNTLYTSNGQTPFVSLGFGLGADIWECEIQKAILQVRLDGLGKDKRTAIFPKLIFALRDGLNLRPEDPQYPIKQLALACASKRIYPDLVSYDKLIELTGDFKYPMGCVAGDSMVQWDNNYRTIADMWDEMSQRFDVKIQPDGVNEYVDLNNVTIRDSYSRTGVADCRRVIRNRSSEWVKFSLYGGRTLTCTVDHPLPVASKGRIQASQLEVGDKLYLADNVLIDEGNTIPAYGDKSWLMGLILCDGCISGNTEAIVSYAFTGEDEIRERISTLYPDNRIRDWEHHRGTKGNYKEFAIKDAHLVSLCRDDFGGITKNDRSIPEKIFHAPVGERLDFMAGMIDADGYINPRSSRVQIGSTNPRIAYGQLRLAESLGYRASIYENHYSKSNPDSVRFRVEFVPDEPLVHKLACTKKKDNYTKKEAPYPVQLAKVTNVEFFTKDDYSYDVTTSSDYFDVSGIRSHNCRSFIQATPDGIIEGRMNLGVVTLNLPRIALEAKNNLESFWELLANRTELMHKALKYKAERTAEAKPENAPILYKNGAFWRRLENGDSVNDLFKNKYATISFGYIGLYETVATFYGSDWENNSEAKEFSLAILSYFKSQTSQWPDYHYSVYGTPAESLTDKFCKADREKFGDIPGITDKEYYTNSFHYDVRKSPTPFEKIDFEAPYPKYASGGFIHYVELPPVGANLKALETIWDYAYDKLGYFGVNTSVDQCFVCGFKGEFDSTEEGYRCPDCGNNDPETADVTRRLCGYLGNPLARPAIHGRQVEIASRAKHV